MGALKAILDSIAATLFHWGGPGLLLVGILDSSFLVMPLANDLLVIALSASHHNLVPYFAAMAAVGSVLGCTVTDVISRKAEQGVEHKVHSQLERVKFVESQIRKHAAWSLVLASVVPPPFPFTPFIVAAAAAGYPRKKLLSVVGVARFVRFGTEGGLAVIYGDKILALAQSPAVEYTVIALIVLAVGGSAVSIIEWVRKARRHNGTAPQPHRAH